MHFSILVCRDLFVMNFQVKNEHVCLRERVARRTIWCFERIQLELLLFLKEDLSDCELVFLLWYLLILQCLGSGMCLAPPDIPVKCLYLPYFVFSTVIHLSILNFLVSFLWHNCTRWMTPRQIWNPVLCFSFTLSMAVCGGAFSGCHEQWQSEVICVLRTSVNCLPKLFESSNGRQRLHNWSVFLENFWISFENKVAGSLGNNYLIISVLEQSSTTIIESVSDFYAVVCECWWSLRCLMLMGCCYVLIQSKRK